MTPKLTYNYEGKNRFIKVWENYPVEGDFCPACQSKLVGLVGPMRLLWEGSTESFKEARCETCQADARINIYNGTADFSLKREDKR